MRSQYSSGRGGHNSTHAKASGPERDCSHSIVPDVVIEIERSPGLGGTGTSYFAHRATRVVDTRQN